MRKKLALGMVLLSGCTHAPPTVDISGLWINQAAIDAAAQGRPLLKTLDANGWNLEWNIDTRTGKAQASSAFEISEGQLRPDPPGRWIVDYGGHGHDELQLHGEQLVQPPREHFPGQVFKRADRPDLAGARWGTTFRQALNSAYLRGKWTIIDGQGAGSIVAFRADGGVSGLGKNDRYQLCLGGDCATQGAGHDTLYLGQGGMGKDWIFIRYGNRLEILLAINQSQPDEIPQLSPGPRQWLLEKQ